MTTLLFCLFAASLLAAEGTEPVRPLHRTPALSAVFPQGARPGEKVRVEVLGQYLDHTAQVIFTDASLRGKVLRAEPTRLELEFEMDGAAAYGPHYFRVVSPRGPSNVLLFRVGDLPHRAEQEPNSRFDQAERVESPVTINARLPVDGDYDFFRFRARAGETLVFDLRAARNGDGLDATMILFDAAGRKLEHDEDTFIWDPFFTHRFSQDGEYVVAVEPRHTRNDPGFAYQLDIRHAPHLESVSPLALRPGVEAEVTLWGAALVDASHKLLFEAPGIEGSIVEARGNAARARVRLAADAKPGPLKVVVAAPDGRSNPATLWIDATPPCPDGAIVFPCARTGTARYREPERFRFDAKAGERLVFEIRAQRYGSPADIVLRVLDDKGKQVAKDDDGNFTGVPFNKDARLSHVFKDGGSYTLEVRNLVALTGENSPYQMIASHAQPGFELSLPADQQIIYAGKTATFRVTAQRRDGHDAEIPLRVTGLPAGVTAKPAAIAAGEKEAAIELDAAAASPGVMAGVEVTAEGAPEPAWRSARIASGGGEGAAFGRVRGAVVAVVPEPDFSLEAALTSVNLVRGGSAEAKVAVRRKAGFSGEIEFQVLNLPPGVTFEPVKAGPGQEIVSVRLRASADALEGRAARVVVRGTSADGRIEDAPRISVLVD